MCLKFRCREMPERNGRAPRYLRALAEPVPQAMRRWVARSVRRYRRASIVRPQPVCALWVECGRHQKPPVEDANRPVRNQKRALKHGVRTGDDPFLRRDRASRPCGFSASLTPNGSGCDVTPSAGRSEISVAMPFCSTTAPSLVCTVTPTGSASMMALSNPTARRASAKRSLTASNCWRSCAISAACPDSLMRLAREMP